MRNSKFRKVIAFILAFALVLGVTSVATFAASGPLFVMSDAETRQGEEFEIVVKFARDITPELDPIAALDVTLSFDSNVYSVVSMENGEGLNKALEGITSGDSNLENDYIFSTSANTPGEVNWSLITLSSFTFVEGEEFMKIRFKANDLSDLTKRLNMTIKVTSAAAPETLEDVTGKFTSYTNKMEVEANLTAMCDWEYSLAHGGYVLVKFNAENVETFTIPDKYDNPTTLLGAIPVVSIKNDAFRENKGIKKIVFGKNIDTVGTAAFFRCENLEKVVVYSKDTRFGANCFYGADENLVIKCLEGSEADLYAQKNNIKVEYFESVADSSCKGTDEKVYYTGSPVKLSNLRVYNSKNQFMRLGVDYVVSYENNTEIGTAKLIITGRGEYVGTKEVEFEILCPYHSEEHACYTEQVIYPDCEAGGYIVKDCTFCGLHDDTTVAPAKEHGEITEIADPDATCTQTGVKKFVCKDCTKVLSTEEIPLKDHAAAEDAEWVTVEEATCEKEGKEVLYCADCDYVIEERAIPVLDDHVIEWVVTTEPTCTQDGVETLQCRFCGYHEGEKAETRVAPAGHKMGEWVEVAPATCDEDGLKKRNCVLCQEKPEEEVLPKTGHKESEWITLAELTCTVDGIKVKYCTTCGDELDREVTTAPGHSEGEWEVVSELTCTQDGVKKLHCSVCDTVYKTETETHEGHKSGVWKTVAATCAKPGAKNHYCSVCDEIYESTPIKQLDHTPGEWEVVAEPTCTLAGMRHKVCLVCGEATETEEIEATEHNYVRTTEKAATYRNEGQDKLACDKCDLVSRYIPTKKLNADIDSDGTITSADALLILQHSTGLKTLDGDALRNANLDGVGVANSADALIVIQIATGLIIL